MSNAELTPLNSTCTQVYGSPIVYAQPSKKLEKPFWREAIIIFVALTIFAGLGLVTIASFKKNEGKSLNFAEKTLVVIFTGSITITTLGSIFSAIKLYTYPRTAISDSSVPNEIETSQHPTMDSFPE